MVRTQSAPGIPGIDPSRVLAFSAAIALHVLALALLLMPLSYRPVATPVERTEIRWQLPELLPTPPPPQPVQPIQPHTAPTPTPVPVTINAPVQQPIAEAPAIDAPHAMTTAPTTSESVAPSITPPVSGVQLQYLAAPPPPYPRTALKDRLTGTVVLRVLVGVDGRPLDVSIESSSGHRVLALAARAQVLKQWRFKPAMQDGRASQAYGLVPISFSLD